VQRIKRPYMTGYTLMKVGENVPLGSENRNCMVTCRGLCVIYMTGSGLDYWIYWHLNHTTWDSKQHSDIADLHTLQFTITRTVRYSVFITVSWQRIQQSHCHFKLHMKSSLHRLIPFLPFLLNRLRLSSPELYQILYNSFKWTLLQLNSLSFRQQLTPLNWILLIATLHDARRKRGLFFF
jgi:hypothetical protein